MATRVFGWDANPSIDSPLYKLSVIRAQEEVDRGAAEEIELPDGRKAIQLIPPPEYRTRTVGALIPFSRVLNKLKRPPPINYPIPARGAHQRPLHVFQINYEPE